jgi:hypothetical protein
MVNVRSINSREGGKSRWQLNGGHHVAGGGVFIVVVARAPSQYLGGSMHEAARPPYRPIREGRRRKKVHIFMRPIEQQTEI